MKYNNQYAGLETSDEILQALEERYDGRVCDPKSESHAEWEDPSDLATVVARAWEIAGQETTKIFWGVETFTRETKMKTIQANPQGGNTWSILIDGEFVENIENDGSSFDAVEDFLIARGKNVDDYEVIETV